MITKPMAAIRQSMAQIVEPVPLPDTTPPRNIRFNIPQTESVIKSHVMGDLKLFPISILIPLRGFPRSEPSIMAPAARHPNETADPTSASGRKELT